MKSEDYSQGDAFQAEKRTVFSTQSLPLCAEGQLARPGDFVSATVGGWSVFAVRDKEGAVRVLRNACRHQNMQVVGTPAGNCETFRCRFHGWTYDLQGRFLNAPPPVAPKDAQSPDLHLASLPSAVASGIVFFSLAGRAGAGRCRRLAALAGLRRHARHRDRLQLEGLRRASAGRAHAVGDFTWAWPLLMVRRAGAVTIMEQVVPHTFLRTRLFTHVFGGNADDHRQAAATIKHVCETLQADRASGKPAAEGTLVDTFHRRLAEAYAQDRPTT